MELFYENSSGLETVNCFCEKKLTLSYSCESVLITPL